jgi:alanyl-tRNA synthetase
MITRLDLKKQFLKFFKEKDHKIIEPSSLIPEQDPTVLFTTAGMHPLVPFLVGQEHPLGKRLADCQICIRTTDIDKVGDKTHFTFFEMLGNWSLGDYYKKEAIDLAWEFLTSKDYLNLDKSNFAFSCFSGNKQISKDEETKSLWLNKGIDEQRISFLEDNWWGPIGDSGPCGPDTEIFYWTGDKNNVPKKFDTKDPRWVEIWNLVFMGYNKNKDNSFTTLKQKNIDTGMGLERICAILNNKDDVFKIYKIKKILQFVESLSNNKIDDNNLKSYKIIVDHLRASVFILGDPKGIKPSNIDQGYILRRFIRRAIRHAIQIGINTNFTKKVGNFIIQEYNKEYNYLETNKEFILKELDLEENKFRNTLEKGLKVFNKILHKKDFIDKHTAFLLYQSYGFPIEMICEISKEKNIGVDVNGFYSEYKKHQELSRQGAKQKFKGGLSEDSFNTRKLHTATHILNQVLRNIIDSNIKQKGSNINSKRLRFDFNFPRKLTKEELDKITKEVNRIINLNLPITKEKMDLDKAIKSGAQAEFGAKYPPKVWVYSIGDFSKEICMGPHVDNTKELGTFKIIKEQSSSAGVRRIKAILE